MVDATKLLAILPVVAAASIYRVVSLVAVARVVCSQLRIPREGYTGRYTCTLTGRHAVYRIAEVAAVLDVER